MIYHRIVSVVSMLYSTTLLFIHPIENVCICQSEAPNPLLPH